MPDRFFYPFAILLIAAMVIGALFAGGDPRKKGPEIDPVKTGFVLEGERLRELVPPGGTTIDFAGDAQNPTRYAVLSAHLTKAEAPPSAGIFGALGPVYEAAYGGRKLEITVRARSGREDPSEAFSVQYFTASVGDSPAQVFQLSSEFEDYTFSYTPAAPIGDPGSDYVGMWPDLEGKSRTMDVERVSVKVANPDVPS